MAKLRTSEVFFQAIFIIPLARLQAANPSTGAEVRLQFRLMGIFNWLKASPKPEAVLAEVQRRSEELEKKITSPVTSEDELTFEQRIALKAATDKKYELEVIRAKVEVLEAGNELKDKIIRALKKSGGKEGNSHTELALAECYLRIGLQVNRINPGMSQNTLEEILYRRFG